MSPSSLYHMWYSYPVLVAFLDLSIGGRSYGQLNPNTLSPYEEWEISFLRKCMSETLHEIDLRSGHDHVGSFSHIKEAEDEGKEGGRKGQDETTCVPSLVSVATAPGGVGSDEDPALHARDQPQNGDASRTILCQCVKG